MLCNRAYNALGWQRIVVQAMRKSEVLAGRAPKRDSFLQYQVTGTICFPGLRVT